MLDGATPGCSRPRPVAGLPVVDADAAARRWLLELIAMRPLAEAAAVPVSKLAAEGPALCAAVLAAVADDAALADVCDGPAARVAAICGAADVAGVVRGVEALRTVLHAALRGTGDAELAADAAGRLAHVCAQVTATALAGAAPAPAAAVPGRVPVVPPEAGHAVSAGDLRADGAQLRALRDAIAVPGDHPVTVVAFEIDDLERLVATEGEDALTRSLAAAERTLATDAAPHGALVRDPPGRWWLVAPRTGTDAARHLAARLAEDFSAAAPAPYGVPLRVSAGVAVFPDDGPDAPTVLDHADQGVFTARALGVPVA